MKHKYREAAERLRAVGLKPSVNRTAILSYLMANDSHPTVDVVFSALRKTLPTLSRTTVYSTLRMLAECGAARMLAIDEHRVRYDGFLHPHAHFVCDVCGAIYNVEADWLPEAPINTDWHSVRETQLCMKGICRKCQTPANC